MGALEGRHAIVVGGGSGIGLASARLLAADGAVVTLAGRTRSKLEDAAASIAVDQLVRVAADELGEHGVRVNGVRPGFTRTAATERAFGNQPMLDAFLAQQPLARHGEVDDIARAVRYLAGPESSWVTGQLLTVDGGHTLRKFVDYAGLMPLPDQAASARGEGAK